MNTWIKFERKSQTYFESLGLKSTKESLGSRWRSADVFPAAIAASVADERRFRNSLVHGGTSVDPRIVQEHTQRVESLIAYLDGKLKSATEHRTQPKEHPL